MSNLVKVAGEAGLFKDTRSGGVIIDGDARNRYKLERERQKRELSQQARINTLEKQVDEIFKLLRSK